MEGARRLEAEEAAADHDGAACPAALGVRANADRVVGLSHDEDPVTDRRGGGAHRVRKAEEFQQVVLRQGAEREERGLDAVVRQVPDGLPARNGSFPLNLA